MLSKVVAVVACSVVLFTASAAHAEESEAKSEPAPPPRTESHWYGYQTLATDGAAIAMAAVSASSDSGAVQGVGITTSLATYAIAPVVIHAVHGHAGKAIGDALLRILVPAAGIGIGAAIGMATWEPTPNGGIFSPVVNTVTLTMAMYEGAAIGGLIGAGTAMAIDAAALSHEEVRVGQNLRDERPQAKLEPKPAPKTGPTFHPTARPTKDGFVAGVGGTF